MTTIYALEDSDGRVRYVGSTGDPERRAMAHVYRARHGELPFTPVFRVLETCDDSDEGAREGYWIRHYKPTGLLLNKDGRAIVPRSSTHISLYIPGDLKAKAEARAKAELMPVSVWYRRVLAQAVAR